MKRYKENKIELTDKERYCFMHIKGSGTHFFLRKTKNHIGQLAYKVMDAEYNPLCYLDYDATSALVAKGLISLVRLEGVGYGTSDFGVTINPIKHA
jgi:hypothetical protein